MTRKTNLESSAERFCLYLETAPFTSGERDTLAAADHWLRGWPHSFPSPEGFRSVFGDLDLSQRMSIANAGTCCFRAAVLSYVKDSAETSDYDTATLRSAVVLYILEAQRLLGSLFNLSHSFWTHFHKRIDGLVLRAHSAKTLDPTSRYAILNVPLDAMYLAATSRNQLEYELLLQAMRTVIATAFGSMMHKNELAEGMAKAMRISNRLGLEEFDNWALSFTHIKHDVS